jgi:hypothetical protein
MPKFAANAVATQQRIVVQQQQVKNVIKLSFLSTEAPPDR